MCRTTAPEAQARRESRGPKEWSCPLAWVERVYRTAQNGRNQGCGGAALGEQFFGGVEVVLGEGGGLWVDFAQLVEAWEVGKDQDLLIGEDRQEVGLIAVDSGEPEAVEDVEGAGARSEIDLLPDGIRRESSGVGGLGVDGGGAGDGDDSGVVAVECALDVEVGAGVLVDLVAGHHGEDAGLPGVIPGGHAGLEGVTRPDEDAGKAGRGCLWVVAQVDEDAEVVVEHGRILNIDLGGAAVDCAVVVALFGEGVTELFDLRSVMEVLDGLLEAEGDEQADDDGGDVDEEVFPGGGCVGELGGRRSVGGCSLRRCCDCSCPYSAGTYDGMYSRARSVEPTWGTRAQF